MQAPQKNKKRAAHLALGPPESSFVPASAPTAPERTTDQPPEFDAAGCEDETD